MVDILGKLFGGIPRVKVMRLFLLNPEQGFESGDVAERSRLGGAVVRRTLSGLSSMGFIKKRSFVRESTDGRTGKIKKKRVHGWFLDSGFPYLKELKTLLIEGDVVHSQDIARRFRPSGKVQLLVISGLFMQHENSRLDLLIVGDNLRKSFIQKTIAVLESELGKELSYALFETADFRYRVSMYDKLLRDMFEYPHERLIVGKEFSGFTFPS